jgi:HAD superfamily hydrolase (TIGR01509 family)
VRIRKPDPRIFHLVLDRLKLNAADAVFLDDTEENVVAARQLGIRSIKVISVV